MTASHVPEHVAIIMDGNGRWAQRRRLPRLAGHRAGTENIRRVIRCFHEHEVRYLTLFAFSTENWRRPDEEVRGLMGILEGAIKREAASLHREGVRLRHLGRLDRLSPQLQRAVLDAIELTRDNQRMTLSLAFDYGGRADIVEATRRIIEDGVAAEDVTESLVSRYLYTAGLPDPDLIIRTGGEMRLSNFLLWQAAYSEYYATPTLWPDFGPEDIEEALAVYSRRERRFGGL
ncbi:MAG: polyprenyl diphosphate synthase [Chloroflexota bacterium]|nr:polyprenyl diphosphate synthase [Chloroflexota bacterium]